MGSRPLPAYAASHSVRLPLSFGGVRHKQPLAAAGPATGAAAVDEAGPQQAAYVQENTAVTPLQH